MTVFTSPFGTIPLSGLTITQRVFQGLTERDRDAMIDGPTGRRVTAGELTDGTRALAGGLRERGIGPGHVVAIMLPNMPDYFACFHGTAWAGATITTVNPAYTAAELHHQLTDSGAEILITLPAFAETAIAGAENTAVREIFTLGEAPGATPLSALFGPPLAEQAPVDVVNDTLVLPYSSGTTGLPKGVMLTHRNLVANVDQANHARPIEPGEWTVGFLPFFHIYGMTVLMNLFLGSGGGVITMPRFDLEMFLKLIRDFRTKQVFVVPPVALALAKHPMVDQYDLSALRYVFSGAAPLGAPLSGAVEARLGVRCEQGYGMTELSPVSHLSAHDRGRAGAVGQTAPSTECRIVDPGTGQDLGAGQEGEVWVRGPQVMKGYLNNPAATEETLLPGGWLRTGDIAAFDKDGYLFIRDRLKELIKVKGFQVAPAEVEAELQSCPGVADAAVVGIPDEEAGELPVAFLVRAPGASVDAQAVGTHLAARLAHYKLPAAYHFVDAIPKSASGKILRRMLKAGLAG
ncbi:AMP-binding protein [Albidovulum sediminicola]|uniref:AMP-binding protein n=1 Tax=Albidovulum sediminicola TaxID=2984331 RepID=A0ABT2YZ53_9RHOB|nr:AMP-binding protein [Defluviimonas sp. WL0075]MCV2864139.1 AMP-binding protein [Defluviimonas sp. WL0075]